jgi:hypothetical protein
LENSHTWQNFFSKKNSEKKAQTPEKKNLPAVESQGSLLGFEHS